MSNQTPKFWLVKRGATSVIPIIEQDEWRYRNGGPDHQFGNILHENETEAWKALVIDAEIDYKVSKSRVDDLFELYETAKYELDKTQIRLNHIIHNQQIKE